MKYGIIVNPAAGPARFETKRKILKHAVDVLGPETRVLGWDAGAAEEMCESARGLAAKVDVLVVAGGDGTFSDVLNAVDPSTVLAFIPLGSGNAWRETLGLPRRLAKIPEGIKNGQNRKIDLILCDGKKKGIFASIGLEGYVLHERHKLLNKRIDGLSAYVGATATSLFGGYKRKDARIEIDGDITEVKGLTTLVVSKTPYYGYAFKVVPQARLDDGHLHALIVCTDVFGTLAAIVTSFPSGNVVGDHRTGKEVTVTTAQDAYLQIDGNLEREGKSFRFEVLPRALVVRS